jgi:8-oxo-dGTP diphosphatase
MPTYEYPRPGLTVDVVALRGAADEREVLLVCRGQDPYAGRWALPGGFVDELERLEHAARRELAEETGLATEAPMRQVGTFGDPGRDPRGWTVGVAFLLELGESRPEVRGGDDAAEAAWHRLDALPRPLAFDHELIIATALEACA